MQVKTPLSCIPCFPQWSHWTTSRCLDDDTSCPFLGHSRAMWPYPPHSKQAPLEPDCPAYDGTNFVPEDFSCPLEVFVAEATFCVCEVDMLRDESLLNGAIARTCSSTMLSSTSSTNSNTFLRVGDSACNNIAFRTLFLKSEDNMAYQN